MTINDYMNLKSITGTKIVSLANIQQILLNNYKTIVTNIKVLRTEKTKEAYRIYLEIPSETVFINYLVILDFYSEDGKLTGQTEFKFFTNSPSAMFNFVYLYNQNNMLIEEFKKYYNPKALTIKPEKRNPKFLLGFEKSVFYAILFVQSRFKNGINVPTGTIPKIIHTDKIVQLINKSKKEKMVKQTTAKTFKF